jgi:hypothetical protein
VQGKGRIKTNRLDLGQELTTSHFFWIQFHRISGWSYHAVEFGPVKILSS